jgi:hypothetical protein
MDVPAYVQNVLSTEETELIKFSLRETIAACEKVVPLAQLAQEYHTKHGRAFRIAVDQADWWYHNVSPEKVAYIRKSKEPYPLRNLGELVLTLHKKRQPQTPSKRLCSFAFATTWP